MTEQMRTFDSLIGESANIQGFEALTDLKGFFEEVAGQADELLENTSTKLDSLREDHEKLRAGMGMRDKFLGGRFGGSKDKSADSKDLEAEIETTDGLFDNVGVFQETFNNDVMEHAISIIAAGDEDFAQTVEFQTMMTEAVGYTEDVLREVDEALVALAEAEDAEEWDMMTDSGYADMESDMANEDAANEVADVTNILGAYRIFLNEMGESAADLHGSDFDFTFGDMMSEDFFGDFWGGSAMLDKIARGQDQMNDLRFKIGQLFDSFATDCDNASNQIEARLNEEWDNA